MGFLHNDKEKFRAVIRLVNQSCGLDNEVIEKDYYITLILGEMAKRLPFIVFKGGTSLSKCHKIINRFSEDIDITSDSILSQGQKKKLKYTLAEVAEELGLSVLNLDETRSRRDYNRYEIAYETVCPMRDTVIQPLVLLETSYAAVSFPTDVLELDSYVGEFVRKEMAEFAGDYPKRDL